MLSMISKWNGRVEVNGEIFENGQEALQRVKRDGLTGIDIKLHSNTKTRAKATVETLERDVEYRITVKPYMTRKATPEFDFMSKWNNDQPMPFRIMQGKKLKETRGMVQMELHGDMYAEKMCTCMKCGRKLDNPVSQYFGIGPECGNHGYINPFDSEEKLREAVSAYRKELQETTWTGWVIKSAIISEEEIEV